MRTRIVVILVGAIAAFCDGPGQAVAHRAQPTTCFAGTPGAIIVGVERHINGSGWSAINMCCKTSGGCSWSTSAGGSFVGSAKAGTKPGTWAVVVPGHKCTVTLTPYKQRCTRA